MDARKRARNERTFETWEDLPGGGRRYSLPVPGRLGWLARYIKEVDSEETTVRFRQEVYDGSGRLRETHEKHPVDLGHQHVGTEES